MTRVGRMRHCVKVQRPTVTKDDRGQDVTQWSHVTTIMCDIIPRSATERMAGMQVASETTHVLKAQYSPNVRTSDRLIFNGRTFDAVGVVNVDERNRKMEIEAKEHA